MFPNTRPIESPGATSREALTYDPNALGLFGISGRDIEQASQHPEVAARADFLGHTTLLNTGLFDNAGKGAGPQTAESKPDSLERQHELAQVVTLAWRVGMRLVQHERPEAVAKSASGGV